MFQDYHRQDIGKKTNTFTLSNWDTKMKICYALLVLILFFNKNYTQGVLIDEGNQEVVELADHEIKHDAITFKNATLDQENKSQDIQVNGRIVHKATYDSTSRDEQDPKSFKV